MADHTNFYLLIAIPILIVILMIESLRKPLLAATGSLVKLILTKGGAGVLSVLVWMIKTIPAAHWIVLKNLFTPRSALLPTLRKNESTDGG